MQKNLLFKPRHKTHCCAALLFVKTFYFVISIVLLLCCSNVGSVVAQNEEIVSFGIRPTKAYEDRPESNSYFSYQMNPGDQFFDEALVHNDGNVPVTLKLFAAEGVTAQNGGTTLVEPGNPSVGSFHKISSWISVSTTEISLQPGEEKIVPFSVTIPPDAQPGQHVGGLMVESVPGAVVTSESGNNQAQFTIKVVKRVGVAVVIDIPGEQFNGLTVDQVGFDSQNELGASFIIKVHNIGNTLLKAGGNLLVLDNNNNQLASIPVAIDTVLPGDTTYISLFYPVNLSDGNYKLSIGLIYLDQTAILENVEVRIRNGKVVGQGINPLEDLSALSPSVTNLKPQTRTIKDYWVGLKQNSDLVLGILLVIGFLVIAALAIYGIRKMKLMKKM